MIANLSGLKWGKELCVYVGSNKVEKYKLYVTFQLRAIGEKIF